MKLQDIEIRARDRRAIRREFDRIRNNNPDKLLKTEDIVEEASDPQNIIHPYFDWDNAKAGHQWRLTQARALIRTIEVVMPDDETESTVPKYVSLKRDRRRPGGGYRETSQVLSSKELTRELEETAKRELEAWSQRYKMLKRLVDAVAKAANLKGGKKKGNN